jgi:ferric-dicitrate binding protein FerR (iron transport regulator)
MTDLRNGGPATEESAERALREGLKANVLSADAMQRIRQATEQEWRETTRAPARRRTRYVSIAASCLAVAIAGIWTVDAMRAGSSVANFGRVVAAESPGLVELKRFAADVAVVPGSSLKVGQRLEMRGDTVVDLEAGGNLRIARSSAIEIRASDVVSLTRGELYVDIPPDSRTASSFRVLTRAGEFRHVGTQFAVLISADLTTLRVREGEVVWRGAAGESIVAAGTEVTLDRDGNATRRQIPTAGRDWSWTEAMAPDIVIENRPLLEFLRWFARETGRTLEMDEPSRQQALSILMHGSVQGLTVTEALSVVMATTPSLKYELPEGVIRVSSTSDSKAART